MCIGEFALVCLMLFDGMFEACLIVFGVTSGIGKPVGAGAFSAPGYRLGCPLPWCLSSALSYYALASFSICVLRNV